MIYNIRCFCNTGFDPVNVPYSVSVLEAASGDIFELPVVDLVSNYWASSVIVKSTMDNMKRVDYCELGDIYYFVTDIKALAEDTVQLGLTPDFWLSTVWQNSDDETLSLPIGGIVRRRRILDSEDTWGKYGADDPLMAPSEPLEVESVSIFDSSTHTITFVESLLDLSLIQQLAATNTTIKLEAVEFESENTTGETGKVDVPYVPSYLSTPTSFELGVNQLGDSAKALPDHGSAIYPASTVEKAISVCRSLGIESGILKQYNYPTGDIVLSRETATYTYTGINGTSAEVTNLAYDKISGNDRIISGNIPAPASSSAPHNGRLYYGKYNAYTLMTVTGSSQEFLPEEITTAYNTAPSVRCIADPRPEGCPYYRFYSYRGDTSRDGFFINALSGAPWTNVPLTYTGASGSSYLAQRERYTLNLMDVGQASNRIKLMGQGLSSATSSLKGIVGDNGIINTIQQGNLAKQSWYNSVDTFNAGPLEEITPQDIANYQQAKLNAHKYSISAPLAGLNAISSALDSGTQTITAEQQFQLANRQYVISKEQEVLDYGYKMYVVAPEMNFPVNGDLLRDYYNNGCIVFKFKYSANDLARINRLLNMYGYIVNEPFNTFDIFNKHSDYDYAEIEGAQISGTYPRWWNMGYAAQLANGIRVWHVKPNNTYYETATSGY